MEDYILREINRIGGLIAALLDKIGLLKKSGAPELIRETAKTEWPSGWIWTSTRCWPERISSPPSSANTDSATRTSKNSPNCCSTSPRHPKSTASGCVWRPQSAHSTATLNEKKAPASLNRYYILKDLDKYIKEPQ
ncbi:MAG: hypothetical protein ACLRSE_15210 [Alistipes finegoldii]